MVLDNLQTQSVRAEEHAKNKKGVRAASGTHPGQVRELNEDSLLAVVRPPAQREGAALLIVADGMGGHRGGDIASKIAVDTICDSLAWLIDVPNNDALQPNHSIESMLNLYNTDYETQTDSTFLEMHLAMAVAKANRNIYDYALKHRDSAGNLGTTVTCALIIGQTALIANVGDSRTYLMRNDVCTVLTSDHSLVGILVEMGQLRHDEVYDHPNRHLVTRSLGHEEEVYPDVTLVELQDNDRLLLCSDGLWEPLRDSAEFLTQFNRSDLDNAVESLIDLANEAGGPDNISVVLAEVSL